MEFALYRITLYWSLHHIGSHYNGVCIINGSHYNGVCVI